MPLPVNMEFIIPISAVKNKSKPLFKDKDCFKAAEPELSIPLLSNPDTLLKEAIFMSESKHCRPLFLAIRWAVRLVYPKITVVGAENLPEDACIAVGNHAQMHGPIVGELYYPRKRLTWCAAQMQKLKEVPAYAYQDFWSGKPPRVRWFYRLASYIIAPLSVCIFNNAAVIPVYHDNRVISTFGQTVKALEEGVDVIIFPEKLEKRNQILYQFQENFVDVAKLYYKRTGKRAAFVPMYLAPALKQLHIGAPVVFDPEAPIADERRRICDEMARAITAIAESLPEHTVVPYENMPKRQYPKNIPCEVNPDHEKTCG